MPAKPLEKVSKWIGSRFVDLTVSISSRILILAAEFEAASRSHLACHCSVRSSTASATEP